MSAPETPPCKICGSAVRIVSGDAPRRQGAKAVRQGESRQCTNASCRSNSSARRVVDNV